MGGQFDGGLPPHGADRFAGPPLTPWDYQVPMPVSDRPPFMPAEFSQAPAPPPLPEIRQDRGGGENAGREAADFSVPNPGNMSFPEALANMAQFALSPVGFVTGLFGKMVADDMGLFGGSDRGNPGPGSGGPAADSPAGGAQAAGGHAPGTGVSGPGARPGRLGDNDVGFGDPGGAGSADK